MRLTLPLLLLACILLTACGGGSGTTPGSSKDSDTDTGTVPAVSGHFFSYVSDGSHIHAVDMASGEVTEVATLAEPTEDLKSMALFSHEGLLDNHTTRWHDLLYVDDGKLYLLEARSETSTPPTPRRLSSADNINIFCNMTASISADGTHEGLLLFLPEPGNNCYAGTGSSYLITTDMGPSDAPVRGANSWMRDRAITRTKDGVVSITGFIGLRNNKLVRMNRSHQTSVVLKERISRIDDLSHLSESQIYVELTTTGGQSSRHLLNLSSNALTADLGEDLDYPILYENHIYSLYTPSTPGTASRVYIAGLDGSAAEDIGCSFTGGAVMAGIMGDLMIAIIPSAIKTLNLKTCEEKTLVDNPNQNFVGLYGYDEGVFFNDPDRPAFHHRNLVSLNDTTVEQAQDVGNIYDWESVILLSNLDKSDGASLRLESYSFQGDRLLLGELESGIDAAEASFSNSNGQILTLGTISFTDAEEQQHSRLYSIKHAEAGSLTLLMEKDFLQQL